MILAFDIGGTDMKYAIVTYKGAIEFQSKTNTPKTKEELYSKIEKIFNDLKSIYNINTVGISVPGIVDDMGFLVTAGALYDLYQIHLKEEISDLLGIPVFVENDAKCATLAEQWLGYGKEFKNFLLLVVGTGIGGGIILFDKLLRGKQNAAGEFGFMQLSQEKDKNGRERSWSLNASVQSGLVQAYEEKTNETNLNGLEVYRRFENGDKIAKEVIQNFYETFAFGVFNLMISFDPEVILIGGAISQNNHFIEGVNSEVRNLLSNHPDMENYNIPKILPSKFLNNSGVLGAAYKAIIGMGEYSDEK